MNSTRVARLLEAIERHGIDHALLNSFASLTYFSGYIPPIEFGPSPFTPVMGTVLCARGEQPVLLLADMESAEGVNSDFVVQPFASYSIDVPCHAIHDLGAKVVDRLKAVPRGTVGVEKQEIPSSLLESVHVECPQLKFVDITPHFAGLRAIKDEDEIEMIRDALRLCDHGQEQVKNLAQPEMSEIEAFGEIRKSMEAKAGTRLPILTDLVSGPRTAKIGGHPTSRRFVAGDLIISDLAPRFKGYWGDTCNTTVVGEPQGEQKKAFAGINAILEEAIGRVMPGVRASDLDAFVRERTEKLFGICYPHHTGHGIGVTWHEEPRIVPYNRMELRPGMVIALEPGIYFDGRWGIRLEHTVLVTQTGAEVLSQFKHIL